MSCEKLVGFVELRAAWAAAIAAGENPDCSICWWIWLGECIGGLAGELKGCCWFELGLERGLLNFILFQLTLLVKVR